MKRRPAGQVELGVCLSLEADQEFLEGSGPAQSLLEAGGGGEVLPVSADGQEEALAPG